MKPHFVSLLNFYKTASEAELVALEASVVRDFGDVYSSVPWSAAEFKKPLQLKDEVSVVGLISNAVMGFSISYRVKPGWFHISRFAVSQNSQGLGLGRGLLDHQANAVRNLDSGVLSVETSIVNSKASKFYQHLGFQVLDGDDLEHYIRSRSRTESEYKGTNAIQQVLIKRLEVGQIHRPLAEYFLQ